MCDTQAAATPPVIRLRGLLSIFRNDLHMRPTANVRRPLSGSPGDDGLVAYRTRRMLLGNCVLLHARSPSSVGRRDASGRRFPAVHAHLQTAFAYRWKQQQGTALWQRSYFDRVLRSEEDTVGVARYLLENPIRAGLATRPEDYPYLGSMTVDVRELLYSVQL